MRGFGLREPCAFCWDRYIYIYIYIHGYLSLSLSLSILNFPSSPLGAAAHKISNEALQDRFCWIMQPNGCCGSAWITMVPKNIHLYVGPGGSYATDPGVEDPGRSTNTRGTWPHDLAKSVCVCGCVCVLACVYIKLYKNNMKLYKKQY